MATYDLQVMLDTVLVITIYLNSYLMMLSSWVLASQNKESSCMVTKIGPNHKFSINEGFMKVIPETRRTD
jgi:hypothetical protein